MQSSPGSRGWQSKGIVLLEIVGCPHGCDRRREPNLTNMAGPAVWDRQLMMGNKEKLQ
jgi:hypothetical protein